MKAARIAAAVALTLALGAGIYAAAAPCSVRGVRARATLAPANEAGREGGSPIAPQSFCQSLLEAQGSGVLMVLGIPVFLTAVGLLAVWRIWKVALLMIAILLFGFVVVTGFSIGLLFFPAALTLLVSAAVSLTIRDTRRT